MSESDQSGAGRREVAYRLFATEFDESDLSYSTGEEERAPNYVITPTGARVNRLFVVGVLTEVEPVSDDVLRARVTDQTGAFVLYAGQYQPDEQAFLEESETPAFVAVTGKARTYQPEDSSRVLTSVRPESINEVSAPTRDRWTVQAAEQTLDRIRRMATAQTLGETGDALRERLAASGVDEGLAAGIPLALDHYGTTPTYLDALRTTALDAVRVVTGDRNEADEMRVAPDESGPETAADLVEMLPDELSPEAKTGAESPAESSTDEDSVEGTSSGETTADETARKAAPGETAGEAESGGTATEEPAPGDGDTEDAGLGDFDPDEYELEAETREQIEEEYGTEFQTGAEVDDAGEADIEIPDAEPDDTTDAAASDPASAADAPTDETPTGATSTESEPAEDTEPLDESEPAGDTEPLDESEPAGDTEPLDESEPADETERPEDLQAALVELMNELDDGDGVDRDALHEEMDTRYGLDDEETEEAIQQALMDGQCYEPDDARLKPI